MKKLRSLLLGTAAGLLWMLAVSLVLVPIEDYQGILHAVGCVTVSVMLVGTGCTVAMLASGKEIRSHGKNDL